MQAIRNIVIIAHGPRQTTLVDAMLRQSVDFPRESGPLSNG